MDIFDPSDPLCSLAVALVLVVVAALWLANDKSHGGLSLGWPMGSPAWDFSQSWASNITVGAAVLALAMTSLMVPFVPKTAAFAQRYIALNVFFVLLGAAAPTVYNALRRGAAGVDNKVVFHGYVGVFLLAAVLTSWAAYGQLAAFSALVSEGCARSLLDCSLVRWMHGLVAAIALALAPFIVQTIYWVVRTQHAAPVRGAVVSSPAPWALL